MLPKAQEKKVFCFFGLPPMPVSTKFGTSNPETLEPDL
jgi:hypothetical protein